MQPTEAAPAANDYITPKKIASADKIPHVGYLDGMRGIAVLGVIAVHCVAATQQTVRISLPLYGGAMGVELFYAVSAFTLFLSMDARSAEPHETRNFFIRRFFRIAPLFYLTIFLSWCRLQFPFVHGYHPTASDYFLGVIFLFGWKTTTIGSIVVGGWSIAVETSFYMLLPVIRKGLTSFTRALLAFVIGYATLIPFSHYLARRFPLDDNYYFFTWFPVQFPMFLMGILIYFAARKLFATQSPTALRRISAIVLTISVVVYFLWHDHPVRSVKTDYPVEVFIVGAFFFAFTLYPWRILDNPIMGYIGKVSFSVYLLHFFVLETIARELPILMHRPDTFLGFAYGNFSSFVALFLVLTPLSIIVAALSYRFIEQPGIALGRRLIKHLGSRPSKPAAILPGITRDDDMTNAPL